MDLQTGQWVGAEALLRWRLGSGKDKGTLVPPDEFIAEAERTGVVAHITPT